MIPTYRRGLVVLDTIEHLLAQHPGALEILIVDQTEEHPPEVESRLNALSRSGSIVLHRLAAPSIPAAMNHGLIAARGDCVLFLDDDIVPGEGLLRWHAAAQSEAGLVAGQVLQPGQAPTPLAQGEGFRFNSTESAWVQEFMGGNFSVDRALALALGGFDQNFVGAAYRFEAEFAHRYLRAHGRIRYEPRALIEHLAIATGGTRAHGHHLRTLRPGHSVGAYYYLLKTRDRGWLREVLWRPIRAVRTRHHLRHPWWIPGTLFAELRGFLLALGLLQQGPRLIEADRATAMEAS